MILILIGAYILFFHLPNAQCEECSSGFSKSVQCGMQSSVNPSSPAHRLGTGTSSWGSKPLHVQSIRQPLPYLTRIQPRRRQCAVVRWSRCDMLYALLAFEFFFVVAIAPDCSDQIGFASKATVRVASIRVHSPPIKCCTFCVTCVQTLQSGAPLSP